MKTRASRRRAGGFTLVELLVVIAIIVVLAAMSFGAANLAIGRARKLEASTVANGIQEAIQRFNSEYSRLPDVGSTGDEINTTSEAGIKLITILLGKETVTGDMQNPRQIPFLTVKEGKNKKGGLVYNRSGGNTVQGIYDPWGNPYYILLDNDYDDEIPDPLKSGNIIRNKICVVYSLGPDKKKGTNGRTTDDDVKTWTN